MTYSINKFKDLRKGSNMTSFNPEKAMTIKNIEDDAPAAMNQVVRY